MSQLKAISMGWRICLVALLLSCGYAYAAITGTTSYHFTRTPSGKIDTRYQDGNDGTPATPLTWSTISAVSVLTTDTGSVNLCQNYLTQPAPPDDDADITVTGGFSLPTGFSLGSTHNCVLSWATPSAIATTVSLTATISGVTPAVSLAFAITVTAPPSSDATAPPYPTGLAAVNNVGSATISWDSSVDNFESDGDAPSGTDYYEIRLDGAGTQTVDALAASSAQFTSTDIGAPSGTSTVQSGNDFTIASSGDIDGATDVLRFLNTQVSGDFTLTFKLNSVTANGATFPKFGALIRNTLVDGVREVACHNQLGTTSQLRARSTDGGSVSGIAQSTESVARFYRYSRVGNALTCESSAGGNSFTAVNSPYSSTIFDGSPYAGLFVVGAAGAASTGVFQNLNLSRVGRVSYTYVTSSSGTIEVRACDGVTPTPNCSPWSAGISIAPTSASDTTPPAAPTSVSCTSGGQTSINCTATAPSDPSGIRGYIWSFAPTVGGTYVPQTEQALIAFTLSGLSASTQRCGKVRAIDNAGNVGADNSTGQCATTDSGGGDPATAPTITSFTQNADRSAGFTLVHSLVTNTHHYNVLMADCSDGQTPGTYATVGAYQHTTASTNLTGFAISDAKSIKVQAANAANTVVFTSSATACVMVFDPWSQAYQLTSKDFVEIYSIADRTSVERAQAITAFNLSGPRWGGVMRAQLQLGMFEAPLSGQATTHSTANPVTGAGYEKGAEVMNFYSAQAGAKNKKFIMMLSDKVHGNYGAISPELFPQYFKTDNAFNNPADPADNGGYFISETGTQGTSGWAIYGRVWDPLVADAYADAVEWMCRHYNDDTNWEGLQLGSVAITNFETDSSTSDGDAAFPNSGYTWAAYISGVKTILVRARQYCTKKDVSIRLDWPSGGNAEARAFWKWARGYRIGKSDFDTVDFVGRTGSVTPGTAGAEGENYGNSAWRGAITSGGTAGAGGVDMRGKGSYTGAAESLDWVRANTKYKISAIDELFDIAKYYKYPRMFWMADTYSCGPDSSFTPLNLGPTGATGTNCPGSGLTIWSLIQQCMAASTDQPALGCTISIRDQALTATCPTDWIGCTQ